MLEEGRSLENINKSSQFHCLHYSEESNPWTKILCSFCSYLSLMIQALAFSRLRFIYLYFFTQHFLVFTFTVVF